MDHMGGKERLTFDKNRWIVKKIKQMIWQDILEYVKIARKEAEKGAICMDVLEDYDNMWGGQDLLYRRDTTRTIHWNIRVLDVDLVNHV